MNNGIKYSSFLLLATPVLLGCVEPLDFPFEETSNHLVVEAALSTLEETQVVRLSTSRNIFNKDNNFVLYLAGAQVQVEDSDGLITQFTESGSGYYHSPADFRAAADKTYKLNIVTSEGKEYESTPQGVIPPSAMGGLKLDYSKRIEKNELGNFVEVDGFRVKAMVNDRVDQRNFYLMRMRITYKVLTFPELFQIFNPTIGDYVSAPKSCCNICWVEEMLDEFVVYSDQQVNGSINAEIPLVFFDINNQHFYDKVYMEVYQYSLSAEAYSFWKAMYDLKFRQGTLFDPAPSRLPGNIYNIQDPEEQVVGYFTVSGVSSTGDFITQAMLGRTLPYTYQFYDDCRELANSTTEQPGFWR